MSEEILKNEELEGASEVTENEAVQTDDNGEDTLTFVNLTDENGVEHRYQLLSIFNAGNLDKQYGALLLQDVVLYQYYIRDGKECGEEISEADFNNVNAHWSAVAQNLDVNNAREGALYVYDTEQGEVVPCAGTILSTFEYPFGGEYVAFIPHAIHFYRYYEEQKGEDKYEISWESIVSTHEYEDVVEAFDKLLQN